MKPQPLFVGGPDDTHEDVVRAFLDTLPADDRLPGYQKGEHWGQWVINDKPYWVTLVGVADGEWAFAVFADGPEFRV